jgi:hypothetical protein
MQSAKWRLVWLAATAVLFFSWIGWLGFEVLHRPTVPARAPFLVADLNVIAYVKDLNEPVKVEDIVWAKDPADKDLRGTEIRVANLSRCRPDWLGPGEYILPLLKAGAGSYEVADATGLTEAEKKQWMEPGHGGLPSRSPGYDPGVDRQTKTTRPPHIYPLTPETLRQVREIHE